MYAERGNTGKALFYLQQALARHIEAKENQGQAEAYIEIGKVYQRKKRYEEAMRNYQSALALNRSGGNRINESMNLFWIATAHRDMGQPAEARATIEESYKIVESLRKDIASHHHRAAYFSSFREYFDFYIDLLMRIHQSTSSKSTDADALAISESTRSRNLLYLLTNARADIRIGADRELIERENKLRREIDELGLRKLELIDANEAPDKIAFYTNRINELSIERETTETQIRSQSPFYSSLVEPKPANLPEIQALLDVDTALVEYSLGEKYSYAWIVTRTTIESQRLIDRRTIESAAKDTLNLINRPPTDVGATKDQVEQRYLGKASQLSKLIVSPLAKSLGKKRLVIVADGLLQLIPFQALPLPSLLNPSKKSLTPALLIDKYDISYLPSASTLKVIRDVTNNRIISPRQIAIFANPVFTQTDERLSRALRASVNQQPANVAATRSTQNVFNSPAPRPAPSREYPSLPRTGVEATRIKTIAGNDCIVYDGFDANLDNAMSRNLSLYRIVHFATHGLLDTENPELSAIILSEYDRQGNRIDQYLNLQKIYDLKLPAELVVLSACGTASGKLINGEGFIGLTRGFMNAGARRVIASLWNVDDDSTSGLMKSFYFYHLKKGLPPAEAFRNAQNELRQNKDYRLPYYWAAFILQGEYK